MRILAISHLFPHVQDPRHGIFAARQFAGFQRSGAEVVLFFPTIKIPKLLGCFKEKWKEYDAKHMPSTDYGLHVIQTPCIRLTRGFASCRWDGLMLYMAMKNKAMQLHREKPFDIIYGRGLFPGADTAVRLSRLLKIPSVGVAIGGDVNQAACSSPGMHRHFLRVLRELDGVLANGQGLAQIIYDKTGRECRTAHGVVDLEVFQPVKDKSGIRKQLGMSLNSTVFLYAGHLKKEKGIYELIHAFKQIQSRHPEAFLYICGNGVEYEPFKQKIQAMQLAEKVHLMGAVDPNEIHLWMQASDVFVLPSYMEGMPNAVMEAMACGLPTVSTTVGGLPDGVGDSRGAILLPPQTVEPLKEAMLSVAQDAKMRTEMSLAARRTAEDRFGLKTNVQKTLCYLNDITAPRIIEKSDKNLYW